jgi:hypothetical protein
MQSQNLDETPESRYDTGKLNERVQTYGERIRQARRSVRFDFRSGAIAATQAQYCIIPD